MKLPDKFEFTHSLEWEDPTVYTAVLDKDREEYLVSWEESSIDYNLSSVLFNVKQGLWRIKEQERDMYIASNQIICKACGDSIYSAHRHDYVTCKCGACSVDGGQGYLKRAGTGWEDISITIEQEAFFKIVHDIETSRLSGRNDIGIALAVLRSIRDHGIVQKGLQWTLED
jgi:hypothetical protein